MDNLRAVGGRGKLLQYLSQKSTNIESVPNSEAARGLGRGKLMQRCLEQVENLSVHGEAACGTSSTASTENEIEPEVVRKVGTHGEFIGFGIAASIG